MSYSIGFSDDDSEQIASNGGYGDFARWVAGLPEEGFAALKQTVEIGWNNEDNAAAVADQIEAALEASPPDATVKTTATGIVAAIRRHAGEAIVITQGFEGEPATLDVSLQPVESHAPATP